MGATPQKLPLRISESRQTQASATKAAGTWLLYGATGNYLLDYEGQDMHHNIYLTGSVASAEAKIEVSADLTHWVEITTKTIGPDADEVSVYSTGTLVDIPFKYLRLTFDETTTISVDSFGSIAL